MVETSRADVCSMFLETEVGWRSVRPRAYRYLKYSLAVRDCVIRELVESMVVSLLPLPFALCVLCCDGIVIFTTSRVFYPA